MRATHRRGAAATELALFLPFLALLFFVAVDYARAFRAAQVIDGCARTGALYASGAAGRDPDAATPEQAAVQAAVAQGADLSPPLQPGNVTITTGTGTVTVTVSYQFAMATGYVGAPSGLTVTRAVTMPIAPKPPGAR